MGMEFDELLNKHVGEFGCGQLLVLLAASFGWATLAIAVLAMVFVTQTPSWFCATPDDAFCLEQYKLQRQDPQAICRLQAGQYSWDNPHSSLVATFGLVCDNSWKVGWANAVFFIGYAIGSSFFGWMADTHGRKVALLASSAVTACVTMLCALSPSYGWYITGHILQGVGCSGLPIAAYVLATESVGPTYRGRAGTGAQMIYHVGEWILPAMAFVLQDWRLLYAAVAACCLVTGLLAALVPESPRWQLLHRREAAAVQTLSWLARLNGRELPQAVAVQLQAGCMQEADQHAAAVGVSDTGSAAGCDKEPACHVLQQMQESTQEDSEGATLLCHSPTETSHRRHHADSQQECQHQDILHQHHHQSDQQQHNHHQQHQHKPQHHRPATQPEQGQVEWHKHRLSAMGSVATAKRHRSATEPQQGQVEWHEHRQSAMGSVARAKHQGDTVWMVFTSPLLARLFWVSAWMCTVMAAAFFTANLATEKLQGSLYVNFILTSIGELPATIIGALAVDALGRRPTIGTGLVATGVACLVCSMLQTGAWSTALASLGKSSCSSTWTLTYIYASELMPTTVRSSALAWSNLAARVGGVVAPFIIYAGEQLGLPKLPFALVGVLSVLTALMTTLLPESKGKGQPDCMKDLQEMYGKQPPSGTCNTNSTPGCTKYHGCTDVTGVLASEGSGLVQRLLSRASSSGSWLVGAMRSSRSIGEQRQWEPVLPRDGSEVQLPLASVRTNDGVGAS